MLILPAVTGEAAKTRGGELCQVRRRGKVRCSNAAEESAGGGPWSIENLRAVVYLSVLTTMIYYALVGWSIPCL